MLESKLIISLKGGSSIFPTLGTGTVLAIFK